MKEIPHTIVLCPNPERTHLAGADCGSDAWAESGSLGLKYQYRTVLVSVSAGWVQCESGGWWVMEKSGAQEEGGE